MSGQELVSIPKGWQMKTLGELFDITSSKRVFKSEWKDSGVPFYRAREIVKLARQGFVDNDLFISREMFEEHTSTKGAPQEGDIMVTGVGTLGICYVVKKDDEFYFKDGNIIWLKNKGLVNSRYVEYAFQSNFLRKQIDNSIGTTVGTYTIIKAKNTLIPVPSEEEQQRIVSILDEAYQNIEHSTTQVITKIQNAEELFKSTLNSKFSEKGEDWIDTTIGDEVDFLAGFAFKSAQYTDDQNGIKLLRGDNIIQGKLRWDGVKRWPKEEYENHVKFALQHNDVVLAMDRPWVSAGLKFSSISQDDLPCLQVQRTARMRAGENLHWRFLFHLIGSHNFIQEMLGGQTGIGVPHISGKQIQSFSFAMPPIEEQIRIAELLDSLSTNTQLLKENFQFELNNYSELRQSILQEAFNGTLRIAEGLAGQS